MRYDFDSVYDRKNTNSLKWDFHKERGHDERELPLWVADMDFCSPKPVIDALHETADRGFFGYTVAGYEDKKNVSNYFSRRHRYAPEPEYIVFAPGVCFALTMAVLAFSEENDAVMISEPVYYPFASIVTGVKRKLIRNELKQDKAGRYEIDFALFEQQIKENNVKLYILCSPHNPVGRVWTKEELLRLGEICLAHGVYVLADEIHADFVYEGKRHIPFASISTEFENNSAVFTSPSKTFNMAGLQIAEAVIKDEKKRQRFVGECNRAGYAEVSVMGLNAMRAAYTECDDWVEELVVYIYENILYMEQRIRDRMPLLHMIHPEGTYLPWVDFRALDLSHSGLDRLIRERAFLWLDAGYIFGRSGEGFERFNVACPRSMLVEALDRLEKAVI